MTEEHDTFYCSFVSIDYIICECGETFPSEDDLRAHLEREHPHKKERKEYKCGVCDVVYPTEQECVDHYENSHMEIKLEHDYVVDPDTLDEYNEDEDEDLKDEPDSEQETYELPVDALGLIFGTNYCAVRDGNQILKFGNRLKGVKKGPSNKKSHAKNVVCEVCGKKYASNAALRYHQRVHTGERPYKCTMCEKTFTMPLFLKIHLRTHTGERPYECPLCPKAFSNKAALLRHDRVHTGVKPYGCPKCGKKFSQSNSMKLHVHTVHLKMPAPYKSKKRRLKEKSMREMKAAQDLKVMQESKVVQDFEIESHLEGVQEVEEDTVQEVVEDTVQEVMLIKQEDLEVDQSEVTYLCAEEDGTYSLIYQN